MSKGATDFIQWKHDLKDLLGKRKQLTMLLPLLKIIWIRITWEPIPLVTITSINSWWVMNGRMCLNKDLIILRNIEIKNLVFLEPKTHKNYKTKIRKKIL